jgi:hypothetical protein
MGNSTYAEKASGIALNKVVIPNIFPNINAYRNVITVGGNTFTIPVGQYTAGELATTVTALLAADPIPVVLSFANNRFTWTNNDVGGRNIDASSEVWEHLGWNWRTLQEIGPDLYRVLVLNGAPPVNQVLAPHPPALFGEKLVHVACDKLSHGNMVHGADGKLHDVLCTVPLGETVFNFTKVWEPHSEKMYRINYKYVSSHSSTLEFQILDSRLRPLPFASNHHIQLVLKLYHKEHGE